MEILPTGLPELFKPSRDLLELRKFKMLGPKCSSKPGKNMKKMGKFGVSCGQILIKIGGNQAEAIPDLPIGSRMQMFSRKFKKSTTKCSNKNQEKICFVFFRTYTILQYCMEKKIQPENSRKFRENSKNGRAPRAKRAAHAHFGDF